jgi:Putative zinc-finger
VALGLLLGGLAGANLATAIRLYRTEATCRRRSFAGLLGALPGLLTGFACCAPAVTFLLGAQVAAALIGLRNWLFPLALAILLAGLAWSASRLTRRGPPARPETPTTTGADALAGAYALDALTERDRARFERHLARCPTCAREQRGLREAAARLAAAVATEPPADLVERAAATAAQTRQLTPAAGKPGWCPRGLRVKGGRRPDPDARHP